MFNFLKRKKKVNLKEVRNGTVIPCFIYQNDNIDIVHRASKICYNSTLFDEYEDKANYISKVTSTGHESVMEHSNLINVYIFGQELFRELSEVLSVSKYVKTRVVFNEEEKLGYLLIGGQIRGYKEIIREIYNQNNPIAKSIIESLYVTNSCYFSDFIEDNIMEENLFNSMDNIDIKFKHQPLNEYLDIINIDPIDKIYEDIKEWGFTYEDALEVSTTTLFIKDISRIISQQITRHNFGISQMSQRYVDYSDVGFNAPYLFKEDKYPKEKEYSIGMGTECYNINQDDLAQILMEIYPQLVEQGMLKEDARGYLPQNNQTSLYITGDMKTIFNFQKLRTHESTQAELREAIALPFDEVLDDLIENKYQYLEPKYKRYESELENEYNGLTQERLRGTKEEMYDIVPGIDEVIQEDEDGLLQYNKEDFI